MEKQDLIILGAGDVGGFLAQNLELFNEKYNLLGFLDDDPPKLNKSLYGSTVIGTIASLDKFPKGVAVAIGIASPRIKAIIVKKISHLPLLFPSFIAKNAWLSNNVKIGKGVIIYPGVSINHGSVINDFVIINMNCALGHDANIGPFCSLAPGVNFGGFTKIGEGVEIGIGVCTIQGITVGDGAIIGGQTMLIKDVSEYTKIVGVPGKKIVN